MRFAHARKYDGRQTKGCRDAALERARAGAGRNIARLAENRRHPAAIV
jgi:hypothetical protein